MPTPIIVTDKGGNNVPQKTGCILSFPLTDYDKETPVPVSAITAATMTLLIEGSGEVIGSHEDEDVRLNFNEDGIFEYYLSGDDNQIFSAKELIDSETHVAVVHVTATGAEGELEVTRELWFKVDNQRHVPNATV